MNAYNEKAMLRTLFKKLRRLLGHKTPDKVAAELDFQREWAGLFSRNKHLVEQYWKDVRGLEEILGLAGISDSSRILDVGCGISTVLHFLGGDRYGVDPLADEYHKIYDYPKGMHILRAKGEQLPFPDGGFDVIFCTNVLDHVDSPEETLGQIRRVLKDSGRVVLAVEVFQQVARRSDCHPHCFTDAAIRQLVARCGFDVKWVKVLPWYGLRNYVLGSRTPGNNEILMIMEKRSE